MRVIKRSGEKEEVSFDKVLNRIQNLSKDLKIDPSIVAQQVCSRITDNILTSQLDDFAATLSSSMNTKDHDYEVLASRILISNLHKSTSECFGETTSAMVN
jgi:hypothetical protein